MKILYKRVGLILFTFCAIFAPPIFPFNFLFVLSVHTILIWMHNKHKIKKSFTLTFEKKVTLIIYIYLIFAVLISFLFGSRGLDINRIIVIYQVCVLIPLQFMVASYINMEKEKFNINIYQIILYAGGIQGVLSVLTFVFPKVRSFFLSWMVKYKGERIYGNEILLSYRGYGFASTLLDTFGYGMGLICGIFLLTDLNKYLKNKIIFMLCLFSIILNSRTGLVILLVALCLYVDKILKQIKLFLIRREFVAKIALLLIMTPVIFLIFIKFFSQMIYNFQNSINYIWIIGGFKSIINFITGREEAYQLGSMQNTMFTYKFWQLPNDFLGFLFGRGHSLYGTFDVLGMHSDVGYVNYIWIIGFLGLTVLIVLVIGSFYRQYKRSNAENKRIIFFLVISFVLMMIKGNIIGYNAGTFITIMIYLSISQSKKIIGK